MLVSVGSSTARQWDAAGVAFTPRHAWRWQVASMHGFDPGEIHEYDAFGHFRYLLDGTLRASGFVSSFLPIAVPADSCSHERSSGPTGSHERRGGGCWSYLRSDGFLAEWWAMTLVGEAVEFDSQRTVEFGPPSAMECGRSECVFASFNGTVPSQNEEAAAAAVRCNDDRWGRQPPFLMHTRRKFSGPQSAMGEKWR